MNNNPNNQNNNRPKKRRPPQNNNNNNYSNYSQPRKALQNTNKQLKQQNNKLKRQLQRLNVLSYNPFAKQIWYHNRSPTLFTQINQLHDNQLAEYVYGIFHPDAVYRENMNIKAPSIVPIPTTNFAFKETFTITPNDKGNFVLAWNPDYLGTSAQIAKLIEPQTPRLNGYFSTTYVDTSRDLDGNSAATNWRAHTYKHIVQDFSKYRLTSACIKIKYTGKVIDQSGMLSACASFMEFPRSALVLSQDQQMTSTYQIPNQFPQLQRLGDFDTIRQGQWAKTISLVDHPDGLTCVYLPTDSLSQAFRDNADTITAKDIINYRPTDLNANMAIWFTRNANITFDVCGYGIFNPNAVPLLTVEAYYNYEILVNEDQLCYFRPTVQTLPQKQVEEVTKVANTVAAQSGTITDTTKHESPNIMSQIIKAIQQGYKMAEPYLPLLKLGAEMV